MTHIHSQPAITPRASFLLSHNHPSCCFFVCPTKPYSTPPVNLRPTLPYQHTTAQTSRCPPRIESLRYNPQSHFWHRALIQATSPTPQSCLLSKSPPTPIFEALPKTINARPHASISGLSAQRSDKLVALRRSPDPVVHLRRVFLPLTVHALS